MARGLNKVLIIGTVSRSPEMRYTPSGKPVTSFTVAVSQAWKATNGERREETEWFNVIAWGTLAEVCKNRLDDESHVYIEGRLQTRGWEDDDGKKHYRTEIVANEMILLEDRDATYTDEETEPNDGSGENFAF